jgi:hypothetical protein
MKWCGRGSEEEEEEEEEALILSISKARVSTAQSPNCLSLKSKDARNCSHYYETGHNHLQMMRSPTPLPKAELKE